MKLQHSFMSTPSKTASEVDALIRMLDAADDRPDAIALRARSYELLLSSPILSSPNVPTGTRPEPEPGVGVGVGTSDGPGPLADVGCGSGRAVAELSSRGARTIGVDLSERMVAVARRRWPEADDRL
jgi:SAM-dependent methyltransferase